MSEDNFNFDELGEMGGSSGDDAGEALLQNESETTPTDVSGDDSSSTSHSQTQSSPATSNEDYSPRERALLDRIEQLTSQGYSQRQTQANEKQFSPQEHNFLDGLDIDEVLSSGENLNKLLLNVYNRGLEQAIQMAREGWSTQAPDLVREHITQHMTMKEMVDNFYGANPDLVNARKTVGAIANEVSQENTELTIEQVFEEAAKRTREALGLPQLVATQQNSVKPNLPSRRQPGNRRNGTATLTGVAKEIDDLLT